jgi:hypothetical protein
MYGAIAQARPVFNGYSGYAAPQHRALADLLERHDPAILRRLAAEAPVEVIVEHHLDPDGAWRRFVESYPGAHVTDEHAGWTAVELPASGDAPLPVPAGKAVSIVSLNASTNSKDINAIVDGDLNTRWHAEGQDGSETILADTGHVKRVVAVVMSLGTYAGQYPRELEVAVSIDERSWDVAWRGDTALLTYDAAVRSPRDAPVTIPLGGRMARYVRLRQTGRDPRRGWTIVELQVLE